MSYSIRIHNRLQDIDVLHDQLQKLQANWSLAKKCTCELNLVLDEIVTNIIQHGGPELRTIDITLEKIENELTITVIDDGPQVDPTTCKTPDTGVPLEKRTCGGLGILLVRRFSNCISYRRANDTNILTVKKQIPAKCNREC